MSLSIQIVGMEQPSGAQCRRRWLQCDGERIILAALESAHADGKWTFELAQQVRAKGTTPRLTVKSLSDRGVRLKTRPGGNDSAVEGFLRGPSKQATEAVFQQLDAAQDGPDEEPEDNGRELARAVVAQTQPQVQRAEDPTLAVVEASGELKGIFEAAVQLKELRARKDELERQLADVVETEKKLIARLDTEPLYRALEMIEAVKGGGR